jgi:hypothetical protein
MLNAPPLLREHAQCWNFRNKSHASILSTSEKKDSVSSVAIQPGIPMSWTSPLVMNKNVWAQVRDTRLSALNFD